MAYTPIQTKNTLDKVLLSETTKEVFDKINANSAEEDTRADNSDAKFQNLEENSVMYTDQSSLGKTDAQKAQARTNIGAGTYSKPSSGIPGTDLADSYQPLDADLTAIAGLSGTSGLLKKTAADTWALDTTSYGTGSVTSVDASGSGGISVSGGPITTSGTLTIGIDSSHKLPTTTEWGDKQDAKPDGTHPLIDSGTNKISNTYIPDSILGQLLYGGTFNGSTAVATLSDNAKAKLSTTSNTITLTNDTTAITGYKANEGIYYVVETAGTFASISFSVGDWLISTGSAWKKIDNTDEVTSVTIGASGVLSSSNSSAQTGAVSSTITHNMILGSGQGSSTQKYRLIAVDDYGHITGMTDGSAASGASGGTDLTLVTTGEKYNWDQAASGLADKMDKVNPTGSGALSINRKSNTTVGTNSVAVGNNTTASGNYSFAEGGNTSASGSYSHAEGNQTQASNGSAHAEGYSTHATGENSHAEGNGSTASGNSSHAENSSTAIGSYSHAEGATQANKKYQHTFGSYNIIEENAASGDENYEGTYIEIVGNGSASNSRSNARTLDWLGNEWVAGNMKIKKTTLLNQSSSDISVNLPSSAGTLALVSDIPTPVDPAILSDFTDTSGTTTHGESYVWSGPVSDVYTLTITFTDGKEHHPFVCYNANNVQVMVELSFTAVSSGSSTVVMKTNAKFTGKIYSI